MKLKNKAIVFGLAALLASCADESPWDSSTLSGEGRLKLYLSASVDLTSEMPTVRSVSSEILPPSEEKFQVRMTSADGSYVKNWNSVKDFEKETEFKAGVYSIEAYYGSPDNQGIVNASDTEHLDAYFYGIAENVKIEPGKETNVQINTTLGNAVVIIEYSDAFKNYFKDWTTELITKGESTLNLGNEEGMAYVIPGDVDVVIEATQQNGKSVKLNPAIFEAEAQHLYKIKYNVHNGEVGHAEKLQLIFNDQPDAEHTIEIELTDELLSGEGPKITTEGFSNGDALETVAGSPYDGIVKFNIDSPDGFSEAILTIKADGFNPSYLDNGVIDLCQATESQKAALAQAGIKVLGIYNPERLAMIDLTEFCRYLSEGNYEISLLIKDRARVADASVKMYAWPISVKAQPYGTNVLGRKYVDIILSYNGTDPTDKGSNPFTFDATGEYGTVPAEIVSIQQAPASRAIESKDYIFRIKVPETADDQYDVRVFLNNSTKEIDKTSVPLAFPNYEVDYDPMAKRVMMKIVKVNDSEINFGEVQSWFNRRLRVFIDNAENKDVSLNSGNIVMAKGLSGGSTFKIKTSLQTANEVNAYSTEQTLNYETGAGVPNGNFSSTTTFINQELNRGGTYYAGITNSNKQDKETYNISVPNNGWATVNNKTCNYSATNIKNTWFLVPSTYITTGRNGNKAVAIRSVGFNYNGTVPDKSGSLLGGSKSYNENSPEKGYTAAGKLFLGSYDVSIQSYRIAGETYNEGIGFECRPFALKGWYKYSPYNGDQGVATIVVKNGNTILAKGSFTFDAAGDWKEFEIPLETNYAFGEKAATLQIMFASTKDSSNDWQYENANVGTQAITEQVQKFLGSELIIDELEFVY